VVPDAELSLVGLGFSDRLDNKVMIADDLLHLAHHGEVQTANAL
jgi:hypothetical protein